MGVTGVLFYFDGKFVQLIEGKEANVKLLHEKLCRDERHNDLQLHKEGELKKRLFPNWSMAFKPIAIENIKGVHGFNDMTLPNAVNIDSVMTLYRALGK
ncbi:hypothetical protein BC343_03065 [Mucilaginibacter pedocola]|uniref:BLUF domain-containing protein n=2 Tax=Mucilaginibacter pedocola TaxID=1792845 RepID=A0A1S9PM49_9SPHI|nr:hypothetical protein BC343_03065 [Mucilaginibacter pedocola]